MCLSTGFALNPSAVPSSSLSENPTETIYVNYRQPYQHAPIIRLIWSLSPLPLLVGTSTRDKFLPLSSNTPAWSSHYPHPSPPLLHLPPRDAAPFRCVNTGRMATNHTDSHFYNLTMYFILSLWPCKWWFYCFFLLNFISTCLSWVSSLILYDLFSP